MCASVYSTTFKCFQQSVGLVSKPTIQRTPHGRFATGAAAKLTIKLLCVLFRSNCVLVAYIDRALDAHELHAKRQRPWFMQERRTQFFKVR